MHAFGDDSVLDVKQGISLFEQIHVRFSMTEFLCGDGFSEVHTMVTLLRWKGVQLN